MSASLTAGPIHLPGYQRGVPLLEFMRRVLLVPVAVRTDPLARNAGEDEQAAPPLASVWVEKGGGCCLKCGAQFALPNSDDTASPKSAAVLTALPISVTVCLSLNAPPFSYNNNDTIGARVASATTAPNIISPMMICRRCFFGHSADGIVQGVDPHSAEATTTIPSVAFPIALKPLAGNLIEACVELRSALGQLSPQQLIYLNTHAIVLVRRSPHEGYLHLMGPSLVPMLPIAAAVKRGRTIYNGNNNNSSGGTNASTNPKSSRSAPCHNITMVQPVGLNGATSSGSIDDEDRHRPPQHQQPPRTRGRRREGCSCASSLVQGNCYASLSRAPLLAHNSTSNQQHHHAVFSDGRKNAGNVLKCGDASGEGRYVSGDTPSAATAMFGIALVDAQWRDLHSPPGAPPLPSSSNPREALRARMRLYHLLGLQHSFPASEVWHNCIPSPIAAVMVPQPVSNKMNGGPQASTRAMVLQSVLDQAMCQLIRINLRGAAIRHLHSPTRLQPKTVDDAAVPVSSVVNFLRTLLSGFVYDGSLVGSGAGNELENTATTIPHSTPPQNFWGGSDNFEKIAEGLRRWLEFGIPERGSGGGASIFMSMHMISGVSVKIVPWLKGVCASNPKQRSHQQQHTLAAFAFFLVTRVVVPILRTQLHFTHSPRNPTILLIFLRESWNALEKAETTRLYGLQITQRTLGRSSSHPHPQVDAESAEHRDTQIPQVVGLRTITKRDVWRKKDSVEAPLGRAQHRSTAQRQRHRNVLYARIRLLPDGAKMRPIASIRRATASYLAWFVRRQHNPLRRNSGTAAPPAASDGVSGCNVLVSRVQPPLPSGLLLGRAPNVGILRDALACFRAGDAARRQHLCLPAATNHTRASQHEYSELRAFFAQIRLLREQQDQEKSPPKEGSGNPEHQQQKQGVSQQSATTTTHSSFLHNAAEVPASFVHIIKADAIRCYDSLPQDRVKQCVLETVPHAYYLRIPFWVASPSRTTSSSSSCSFEYRRHPRPRLVVMADEDFSNGLLRGIPMGHIYEEPAAHHPRRSPRWDVSPISDLSAQVTIDDGPFASYRPTMAAAASVCQRPYERLSGDVIRAALLSHTTQHLVSLRGGLYKQSIGILQGSPVALAICDGMYREVDERVCEVLASYAGASDRGLLLRRVDDVLVGCTSQACAEEIVALLREGAPSVGFRCSEAKLVHAAVAHFGPPVGSEFARHSEREGGDDDDVNNNACNGCTSGSLTVPWCGLVVDLQRLEVGVDWGRLLGSRGHLLRRYSPLGARRDVVAATHKVLSMLQVRLPAAVLCGQMNSALRVLRTFCEACCVWAEVLFGELLRSFDALPLHPLDLLRAVTIAKRGLVGVVCVRRALELRRLGSVVPLSPAAAAACVHHCCWLVGKRFLPGLFAKARVSAPSSDTATTTSSKLRSVALLAVVLERKARESGASLAAGKEGHPTTTLRDVEVTAGEAVTCVCAHWSQR